MAFNDGLFMLPITGGSDDFIVVDIKDYSYLKDDELFSKPILLINAALPGEPVPSSAAPAPPFANAAKNAAAEATKKKKLSKLHGSSTVDISKVLAVNGPAVAKILEELPDEHPLVKYLFLKGRVTKKAEAAPRQLTFLTMFHQLFFILVERAVSNAVAEKGRKAASKGRLAAEEAAELEKKIAAATEVVTALVPLSASFKDKFLAVSDALINKKIADADLAKLKKYYETLDNETSFDTFVGNMKTGIRNVVKYIVDGTDESNANTERGFAAEVAPGNEENYNVDVGELEEQKREYEAKLAKAGKECEEKLKELKQKLAAAEAKHVALEADIARKDAECKTKIDEAVVKARQLLAEDGKGKEGQLERLDLSVENKRLIAELATAQRKIAALEAKNAELVAEVADLKKAAKPAAPGTGAAATGTGTGTGTAPAAPVAADELKNSKGSPFLNSNGKTLKKGNLVRAKTLKVGKKPRANQLARVVGSGKHAGKDYVWLRRTLTQEEANDPDEDPRQGIQGRLSASVTKIN